MGTYWIGVDPGTPLSLALVTPDGKLSGHSNPANVLTDGTNDPQRIFTLLRSWVGFMRSKGHDVKAVIERVGIRPGENLVHAVPFIGSMYMAEAICASLDVPVTYVHPSRWKRAMKLTSQKGTSVALARASFPDKAVFFRKKKDHNTAEAALLALYAVRNL